LIFKILFVRLSLFLKMAESAGKETQPKHKGKAVKVIALVVLLVVIVGVILFLALNANELFGGMRPPADQTPPVTSDKIDVGTAGAASTMDEDDIIDIILEDGLVGDDEVGYVFCEELSAGDLVAPEGSNGKYQMSGPVWLVYVDENPNAWFAHDVDYIFVDSSTGEKKMFDESWPPEINGEGIFEAEEDCLGMTQIQLT
jgi:hypothetical protein